MTPSYRGRDDQGHLTPLPTDRKAGNPSDFCNPANDNLKGPWPLIPFSENTAPTVPNATTTSIDTSSRTLRRNIFMVAYGIVVSIAMLAWVYLIGMTLFRAVEWALAQ